MTDEIQSTESDKERGKSSLLLPRQAVGLGAPHTIIRCVCVCLSPWRSNWSSSIVKEVKFTEWDLVRQAHSFSSAFSVIFPYATGDSGCFSAPFHLKVAGSLSTDHRIGTCRKCQQGRNERLQFPTTQDGSLLWTALCKNAIYYGSTTTNFREHCYRHKTQGQSA